MNFTLSQKQNLIDELMISLNNNKDFMKFTRLATMWTTRIVATDLIVILYASSYICI